VNINRSMIDTCFKFKCQFDGNCFRLILLITNYIQNNIKNLYKISKGSSMMEDLKEGKVISCLARPFFIAKLTRRLQIFRA
jgi:hypothetical protein